MGRSQPMKCEKGFLKAQTSRPICSFIYITVQIKGFRVKCMWWHPFSRGLSGRHYFSGVKLSLKNSQRVNLLQDNDLFSFE